MDMSLPAILPFVLMSIIALGGYAVIVLTDKRRSSLPATDQALHSRRPTSDLAR